MIRYLRKNYRSVTEDLDSSYLLSTLNLLDANLSLLSKRLSLDKEGIGRGVLILLNFLMAQEVNESLRLAKEAILLLQDFQDILSKSPSLKESLLSLTSNLGEDILNFVPLKPYLTELRSKLTVK